MFYSKSTKGFYDPEINNNIPLDSVEITAEYYAKLLSGQSDGKVINTDSNGYPVLTDMPPPTIEEQRAQMVLTPAQARVKLANLGMLSNIESQIAALPVDNLTRIYWFYATEFRRDDAILTTFCADSLGMTVEQIDNLFS